MANGALKEDDFYEHEPSGMIVCGACANDAVAKSRSGEYKDDEVVTYSEYYYVRDQDDEPYQCESCNKQNDAYDTVLDEDGEF